jgi:hypothetical protein
VYRWRMNCCYSRRSWSCWKRRKRRKRRNLNWTS